MVKKIQIFPSVEFLGLVEVIFYTDRGSFRSYTGSVDKAFKHIGRYAKMYNLF
jgi:hypothetical protein